MKYFEGVSVSLILHQCQILQGLKELELKISIALQNSNLLRDTRLPLHLQGPTVYLALGSFLLFSLRSIVVF